MSRSEQSQPNGTAPVSTRAKCPRCGEFNSYLPKLVVRTVNCAKCGHAFAPGYAQINSNYAPPPQPLGATDKSSIVSLLLGLISFCLAVLDVTIPAAPLEGTIVLLMLANVLAIIFGIQGLIHSKNYHLRGGWTAIVGISLGSIGLLIICSVLFGGL